MSRCSASVAVALAVTALAGTAHGGGGAAIDAYEGVRDGVPVDVHGIVDTYAQVVASPAAHAPLYRAFDDSSGSLALDLARLTVARRPRPFGFRLDAAVGDTADAYMQSDPAARSHPALARAISHAEQAFVTAAAAGDALSLDVGKFATPVGLEDNETPTNFDYSRSLLFTLAEPTYHSGVRATLAGGEAWGVSAMWLDGWNTNLIDGNGMRSGAAAMTWRVPSAVPVDLALVYAGGLERRPTHLEDPSLGFRHELDGAVVVAPLGWLQLAATADYGTDDHGRGASWWGVSSYARCRLLPWLAMSVRGEHLDDGDGFLTGTSQRIAGVTWTLQTRDRVGDVTVYGWVEVRRDQSDQRVFGDAPLHGSLHQDTVTLAVSASF